MARKKPEELFVYMYEGDDVLLCDMPESLTEATGNAKNEFEGPYADPQDLPIIIYKLVPVRRVSQQNDVVVEMLE